MEPLNRFPRMMQEYVVARIRALDAANRARIQGLGSAAEARAYVEELRAKLPAIFGELPERTDLKARIVGALERDDYVIERVIFESRPNFPVTANLYLPRAASFPAPGVIIPSDTRWRAAADYNQPPPNCARAMAWSPPPTIPSARRAAADPGGDDPGQTVIGVPASITSSATPNWSASLRHVAAQTASAPLTTRRRAPRSIPRAWASPVVRAGP